jgi:exopolysaccharide production protein ExoQ
VANVWIGSVVGLAAFLAAVALVVCVAGVLHWGRHRERGLMPYIFYPAVLVLVLTILFSGRNLELPLEYGLEEHPLAVWATRFTSLFLLFAAVERIGRRVLLYEQKTDVPVLLILALWLYFLTNVVSSGLFGTRPWLSHYHVYTVLVGYAALLVVREEGDTAIRSVRNALYIFLVLGALCILWRPEMVLNRNYSGLFPWLTTRYYGLSMHPNSLGSTVVVFLLCLWTRPYSARWLNLLGWTIGCASLVLSQSKTSWVAFLFCAGCIAYFRHGESLAQRLLDYRRPLLPAVSVMLAMFMVSLLGVAVMFGAALEWMVHFFEAPVGTDITTLMGRSPIWEVAIREWRNNPLFGYGLTMWNEEYRTRLGMTGFAYTAHNQLFQSLAVAGIVGVAGLVIYVLTLLWFALKTTKASQGLTLALFVLMSVQSTTEVPLSMTSGYGPAQQVHLLLLMVIASRFAGHSTGFGRAMAAPRHRLALS